MGHYAYAREARLKLMCFKDLVALGIRNGCYCALEVFYTCKCFGCSATGTTRVTEMTGKEKDVIQSKVSIKRRSWRTLMNRFY